MRRPNASRRFAATVVLAAVALAAVLVAGSIWAPAASAVAPPTPWDGSNPFHCTLQNAGTGTSVPDPGADPYCVQFDKTHQTVTDLGIVDFLLKEPARVAAASPKCFYFQSDHWRGAVSPGDPPIYEFEGHYFFNKATGDGGVWVTGFTVFGQTFDPTSLPGFPPGYGQDFGPGTGGFITHDEVPTDPQCVAQAAQHPATVYSRPPSPHCVAAATISASHVGPVRLGMTEDRVRVTIGPPADVERGFLHYCVRGGGSLLVGQPGDRSGTFGTRGRAPTVMLVTTAPSVALRSRHRPALRVGMGRRALRRAFPAAVAIGRARGARIWRLRRGLLAGVSRGRISLLAAYAPRRVTGRTRQLDFLRRS